MNQKIVELTPGLLDTRAKINQLSNEIERAIILSRSHDMFYAASSKATRVTVTIPGPRGGVGASFDATGIDFEEIVSIVMRMLNEKVSKQYDVVKKLKEEL